MALTADNNSPEVQKTNLNDPFKIVAAYLKCILVNGYLSVEKLIIASLLDLNLTVFVT